MPRIFLLLALLIAQVVFAQGLLIPTDTSLGPLGIKYQRVSVDIIDGAAVTRVEQVFVNASSRQLEAQYVFPLPKGAALQDFYLWINGKKTKGEVLEKKKAAEIYEGIVRRLQDPGLLEYIDSEAFRARVFPIPPRGEQKIELTFSQVLDFQSGLYQYHFPLGASTRGAPALFVNQDFTFSATIKSKTPLRSIYSPTHKLGVSRKGDTEAIAGLEMGPGTDISKDLDLFYTVSDKAIGLTFMSYRPNAEEAGFFTALIAPKTETRAEEVMAKRITFVMDTSGSMMGERIKLARESLRYCVQRLNPKDEFNVVRFSTDVEALFEKPQTASPENVKKAMEFANSLEAIGGTAIDEALQRALKDAAGKGEKPHLVMFITDGQPTVGVTEEAEIAKRAKDANVGSRVFTFGVGDDLNARLLDRIADEGRGTSDFVHDGRDFETKISGFYDKIANPVLADVALDLSAFGAYDVYPKKLPDLFKGTQLVVMGRYRAPKEGVVMMTGFVNGQKKVFEYRAEAVKESRTYDFVPRLWAIRKVGYLLGEIRLNGERPELRDEVIALGKKYGIVTPYTSYLVVEDVVATPTPRPILRNRPLERDDNRPRPWSAPKLPAPSAAAPEPEVASDEAFVGRPGEASQGRALEKAEGVGGIALAKKVREMKDSSTGPGANESVRTASGRTFLYRHNGWVDAEAVNGTPKQLKVKYLSAAYFALLAARPELKAALSLADRLIIVIAKDKSVVIDPNEGETKPDKVTEFIK